MFHADTYKKEITADHSQRSLQHLFIRLHRRMGKEGCFWSERWPTELTWQQPHFSPAAKLAFGERAVEWEATKERWKKGEAGTATDPIPRYQGV